MKITRLFLPLFYRTPPNPKGFHMVLDGKDTLATLAPLEATIFHITFRVLPEGFSPGLELFRIQLTRRLTPKSSFAQNHSGLKMSAPVPLLYEHNYHIYNRGNNGETLFRHEHNYHYFLELYAKHISPIADTFAYSLLPNHFHLAVRIKPESDIAKDLWKQSPRKSLDPGQNFGNLFNAYTKAVNKVYRRTGSLFEKPFHRKLVDSDAYFTELILYIHSNPQKHGLIDDFRLWPFSSYAALASNTSTRLCRDEVLAQFGGREGFDHSHNEYHPETVYDEFD